MCHILLLQLQLQFLLQKKIDPSNFSSYSLSKFLTGPRIRFWPRLCLDLPFYLLESPIKNYYRFKLILVIALPIHLRNSSLVRGFEPRPRVCLDLHCYPLIPHQIDKNYVTKVTSSFSLNFKANEV